jgi:transmembrane sensor
VYVDASFAELVADISRYYDGEIRLASKEVGKIRISGVFWTSKINDLIETLPQYLPVNVQYQGDHIVIIGLNQNQS